MIYLKGPVFFNAGCNKQVFSPKPWKKFGADHPSCRFQKKNKNRLLRYIPIPKNDVTDPEARLLK